MNNKILSLTLVSFVFWHCIAGAQQVPEICRYWPDTDAEWNTLTNHIMWCYNSLMDREYAVLEDGCEWVPSLIRPLEDYTEIARRIDRIAPYYVNSDKSSSGNFDTYFATLDPSTGQYPTSFPFWTVEQLHSNAFSRASWSTNRVLEAWMAVTNRAIVSEVTAALLKLKWSEMPCLYNVHSYDSEEYDTENLSGRVTDDTGKSYGVVRDDLYSDYFNELENDWFPTVNVIIFSLQAYNYHESGKREVSARRVATSGAYVPAWTFDYLAARPSIIWPLICPYMWRTVQYGGYTPSIQVSRQTMFRCDWCEQAAPTNLFCMVNPLGDMTEGCFPLEYAGMDWDLTGDAFYHETGDYTALIKWCFDEAPPALPDAPPAETPDTDRDDVVDIFPVEAIPGHGTGSFVLTHEDEGPCLYLPLAERLPWDGDFMLHAYLAQCPSNFLPFQTRSSWCEGQSDRVLVDKLGHSVAYSLNTRIQEIAIVSNETGWVKQVLVIRPRGQAVIFDFPWEGSRFSSKGYPTGVNKNLGYVLMCAGEDTDDSDCFHWSVYGRFYYLVFPSGVVHGFDAFAVGVPQVFDCRGFESKSPALSAFSFRQGEGDEHFIAVTNPLCRVVLRFKAGVPVDAEYFSSSSGELVESVGIGYRNGVAANLVKQVDSEAGAEVVSDRMIRYRTGFSRARSRTVSGIGGGQTATLSEWTDDGQVSQSWQDTRQYDERHRLVRQTLTRDDGSEPVERVYTYYSESQKDQRLPETGMLVRRLVYGETVQASLGTEETRYSYTADKGWPSEISRAFGGGVTEKRKFTYGECAIISTNDLLGMTEWSNPASVLHLASEESFLDGNLCGKVLIQNDEGLSRLEICATTDSGWGSASNICVLVGFSETGAVVRQNAYNWGADGFQYPLGGAWYYEPSQTQTGCSATQLVRNAIFDNGRVTNAVVINSRGTVLRKKRETIEGLVLENTVTDVDGKGRPIRSRFLDGTEIRCEDYCLHGPRRIVNRDGSVTTLEYDPFGRVIKKVDGVTGITWTYTYDSLGKVIRQVRAGGGRAAEETARYGLDGVLLHSKGEDACEVTVSGQNVGGYRVITRQETGRGDVTETYWADGVLKSVSGAGAEVRFDRARGVADNKLWIKQVNPDNAGEWVKEWHAFNGLYAYTERPGGVIDSAGYDGRLNLKSALSGDGVRTVFEYDRQRPGSPSLSGVSASGGLSLNMTSDPCCVSNSCVLSPQGLRVTRYSFPEDGSAEPFQEGFAQVSPPGTNGSYEVNGRTATFLCNAPPSKGTYTKTVSLPDGGEETYTYRKFLLREVTRRDTGTSRKVTKTFRYDGFGEMVEFSTDERGYKETVAVGRNGRGLVNRISSSSLGDTSISRNEAGQVTQVSDPFKGMTSFSWLNNGLLGSVRTGEGPLFSRSVDAFGRDSAVSRDGGGEMSSLGFSYGNDGGLGGKVRDGVCTLSCSSRRADGRANLVTLPGGLTISSVFDGAGFLVSRLFADPSDPGAAVSETYSWRRDGGLRKASQVGGPQLSNSVFRLGNRVVSVKTAFGSVTGDVSSVATSLTGPEGREDGTAVQFAGFSNMVLSVGAEYNAFGQTCALVGDGFYATYSCAAGGLVTNTLIAVGGVERLSRSVTWSASAGKPARVDYTLGGQFLRRWQYAFGAGKITRVDRFGGDGFRTDYTYDAAGQLVSAPAYLRNNGTLQPFAFLSSSYSYKKSGDTGRFGGGLESRTASSSNDLHVARNFAVVCDDTVYSHVFGRVSSNDTSVKVSYGNYTNDASMAGGFFFSQFGGITNRTGCVSGVANVSATLAGGASELSSASFSVPKYEEYPSYNPRGSILSDSRRRYRWDALERLTAVTNTGVSPAVALTFQYYPDGRRASKTVLTLTNGEWRVCRTLQYAWEGWKLAAECERDATNGIAAVRHFVWGPDIAGQQTASLDSDAEGVGGLLLIREWKPGRGLRVYLPISDGLGSVCSLIDASDGSLAAEFDYDPYGNPVIGRGPAMAACPFRHRTRYYDPETWLYYYGYRYYDPSVTKWISKDPLGEAGGWNLTAFCDNDPVNKYDALGLAGYFFDGTGNDIDDFDSFGNPLKGVDPTSAPTHVAAMFWMYSDAKFYINGVGTRSEVGAGKLFGKGARNRLNIMFRNFEFAYLAGDKDVDIFGFSRGAAMAREFANMIHDKYPDARIRFLGLFDTVAQFGAPDDANSNEGIRLTLPVDAIDFTAHAVATEEYRCLFPLTSIAGSYGINAYNGKQWGTRMLLMPWRVPKKYKTSEYKRLQGEHYWEEPFEGAHADNGGGYQDGTNLDTLKWMYENAVGSRVPVNWYSQDFQDKKCYKRTRLHNSRYPLLDEMPWIEIGRYTRRVYGD